MRPVIFEDAMAVLAAMEREGVRYVMVGSMAMAANGVVRATRDVDFVVAADEENIARLRAALRSVFDDPSIDEIDAAELAGEYTVVRTSRLVRRSRSTSSRGSARRLRTTTLSGIGWR
jgi:hypothetical protein